MQEIPNGSVDMILCDLPYGITKNKWDSVIDLDELWKHYLRITKKNAAIVLTGQGMFSHILATSQPKNYRYQWVWKKTKAGGFMNANRMPLSAHEDILVFYRKLPTYNPQFGRGKPYKKEHNVGGEVYANYGKIERRYTLYNDGARYPITVIEIPNGNYNSLHPTQKPVALFEYLIRTYTNPGEVVLDNCCGSGTTAIASLNSGRRFICIEQDEGYATKAISRVDEWKQKHDKIQP